VIDRPASYIGLIGSARKRRVIYDDMERRGTAPSRAWKRSIARSVWPIGAVTVPEIAVSIAAELVKHRRARPAGAGGSAAASVPGPIADLKIKMFLRASFRSLWSLRSLRSFGFWLQTGARGRAFNLPSGADLAY